MTHIRILINGEINFDGDPGEWTSKPPDFIKDLIKPGVVNEPQAHMKAVMMAMTDAAQAKRSVQIEARTWPNGWSICVEEVHGVSRGCDPVKVNPL